MGLFSKKVPPKQVAEQRGKQKLSARNRRQAREAEEYELRMERRARRRK